MKFTQSRLYHISKMYKNNVRILWTFKSSRFYIKTGKEFRMYSNSLVDFLLDFVFFPLFLLKNLLSQEKSKLVVFKWKRKTLVKPLDQLIDLNQVKRCKNTKNRLKFCFRLFPTQTRVDVVCRTLLGVVSPDQWFSSVVYGLTLTSYVLHGWSLRLIYCHQLMINHTLNTSVFMNLNSLQFFL